ncbi:MAG: hypothetical protein V3W19_08540 [Desulfatiglandales bacterium]
MSLNEIINKGMSAPIDWEYVGNTIGYAFLIAIIGALIFTALIFWYVFKGG